MKHTKVVIASANGFGNAGDDICGLATESLVKKVLPTTNVLYTRPPVKRRHLWGVDVLILGGGGLLYDGNYSNVHNYTEYIRIAHQKGALTIGLALGDQGITTDKGKERYRLFLNKLDLLSVRSVQDREALAAIGVKSHATQDLAFLYKYDSHRQKSSKHSDVSSGKRIAFVLSDQTHHTKDMKNRFDDESHELSIRQDAQFKNAIRKAGESQQVTVIAQSRDDVPAARKLAHDTSADYYEYSDKKQIPELLDLYASQDLVVTQRFHGLVFSLMLGVPCISLGYKNEKQYKLLQELNEEGCMVAYDHPDRFNRFCDDISSAQSAVDLKSLENVTLKSSPHKLKAVVKKAQQNEKLLRELLSQ